MFESISFAAQNKQSDNPIDIGWLVECMLFYENTTVIANSAILRQLIIFFGVDRIIELIEEGLLNIAYRESSEGIVTNTENGIQLHSVIGYSSPAIELQNVIRKICIEATGKPGKGKRIARRIENKIKTIQHENIILKNTQESFLNQDYIEFAAKQVIKNLVPEYKKVDNITFNTEKIQDRFKVTNNINFAVLNEIYHKYVPSSHSTISEAYILSHVLNAESELYFSSNNSSELAISHLSSKLIEQKVCSILEKSRSSEKQLSKFQSFVFNDSKILREAVNDNKVDIDDLIDVLKNANKFRNWIAGIDPKKDLIKSYYSKVTEKTFIDKLPGKITRWSIFTGTGIAADIVVTGGIGTTSGIALGAFDTFCLDKLISGWKPNQFIEGEVKELIEKSTQ